MLTKIISRQRRKSLHFYFEVDNYTGEENYMFYNFLCVFLNKTRTIRKKNSVLFV